MGINKIQLKFDNLKPKNMLIYKYSSDMFITALLFCTASEKKIWFLHSLFPITFKI